ncbi:MAG: glycoside hydrolase family 2 [Tannerellaceae bacterium]|jgi:hypothetical protein|nr:glycoside hydrolase family 2 [Tannerellaceae bacterium]
MKTMLLKAMFLTFMCMVAQAQTTERVYLSGTSTDDAVQWDFYCTAGLNSGKWSQIPVPSNWEMQGFGSFTYGHDGERLNESGLYRYRFQAPASWKSKRVKLVFDGSMTDTEVKINGRLAGEVHRGAFYRFSFDISKLLKYGGENLLEVRVDKASADKSVEAAERRSDFWVLGGIYRPVWLDILPPKHIERLAIDGKMDGSFAMDVFLSEKIKRAELIAQVSTIDGKPFGNAMRLNITDAESAHLSAKFDRPALWSSEFPNRYKVDVALSIDGKIVHRASEKFGFRTVELRPGDGFYVNDAKIRFKGVNRHILWPSTGRAVTPAISLQDAQLIKEMNMNAVRMSHYSPDEHFLDICDSLGLYVLDELTAWQWPPYDTPVGQKLVRELVYRDQNHPCIVTWDNGNEGGFNMDLVPFFHKYDIQKRPVIHPWLEEDNVNTYHYMAYGVGLNFYFEGNKVFFPTEFLHGLYDGGHGAGLDDYWNLMLQHPLSAGGFLWDFADQALVRHDKDGFLDTDGDHGADGILGPYREKEGSFYAIKEIWSPIYLEGTSFLPASFKGSIRAHNRYHFTNLEQCKFSAEWLRFDYITEQISRTEASVTVPSVLPGFAGDLQIATPADFASSFDALKITAVDPSGKEVYTWTRTVTPAAKYAARIIGPPQSSSNISTHETNNNVIAKAGDLSITIDKSRGVITEIKHGKTALPLTNGPRFTSGNLQLSESKAPSAGSNVPTWEFIFRTANDNADRPSRNLIRITLHPDEWIEFDYSFDIGGRHDHVGVTFDFPDKGIRSLKWLGNGPYRVWKNRLKGVTFGIWEKDYNNTVTGESWTYPEFKGFHSNLYAADIRADYGTLRIVAASEDLFLHLLTPDKPRLSSNTNTLGIFPDGNLSILNGISPVGTKFMKSVEHGPQGLPNVVINRHHVNPIHGKFYMKFEAKQ